MNRSKAALATLLLIVSACAFAGCSNQDATPEATKKATDSQKATSGEASLGNPKPPAGSDK